MAGHTLLKGAAPIPCRGLLTPLLGWDGWPVQESVNVCELCAFYRLHVVCVYVCVCQISFNLIRQRWSLLYVV